MVRARLPVLHERPLTRGDCAAGPRPCPYVTCRHHLLVDVAEDGRLLVNRELEARLQWGAHWDAPHADVPDTCSLDVADRGGVTASRVGELLGLCRQEVHQTIADVGEQLDEEDFEEREHPEDFYLRYTNLGADELADLTAELRARGKAKK